MKPSRRRVLLVTSSYAPAITADMHRARHLAWEMPALGWEAEVLYPNSHFQRSDSVEPAWERMFSSKTSRHEVAPRAAWLFRLFGMRSAGWRAFWPLYERGSELLSERRFDLVYITTTHFELFCLGRKW